MINTFRRKRFAITIQWFITLLLIGGTGPSTAAAGYACATGAATPAFLTEGVDPNLLLMFDNSASMLDLAYVESASTCYADDYSSATTYAGYFETSTWYAYDFTNKKFTTKTATEAATQCAFTTSEYVGNDGTGNYVCLDGTVTNSELTAVTNFYAKGNYLNWATATKIDIQKEILTGGKYDSTNTRLEMESRGCGNRRFVKEVSVKNSSNTTYYLALGIRPPKETDYNAWAANTAYTAGTVVSDAGTTNYYIAATSGTSLATAGDISQDTSITWVPRYWKTNQAYPAGSVVSDPSNKNTIDEGQLYITPGGGTSSNSGTGIATDTGITDWLIYDLTHIEIFNVGTTKFDADGACQAAVEEMQKDSPNQGQLKQYIDDCFDYKRGQNQGDISNYRAAFNHSIHNCWYLAKHDQWPNGNGPVNSIKPACQAIYDAGIQPWEITTDNPGYVCTGFWTGAQATDTGYVGRCWKTVAGGDCQLRCKKGNAIETCNTQSTCEAKTNAGGCGGTWGYYESDADACTTADWDAAGYDFLTGDEGLPLYDSADNLLAGDGTPTVDECISMALKDYCGTTSIPEVIDPSDQVGSATGDTEAFWNIPAVLIDSGIIAQMGQPIATMVGYIAQASAPQGLIQEFDDDIRMGAMTFNNDGSKSECTQTDPYVLYECTDTSNKDGGKVIQEIGQSASHTTSLVTAINNIKATSWTPLAEAMYNAIGYYAQDTSYRLDAGDFATSTNPVTAYCQDNNVLIITEGASTADISSTVTGWAAGTGHNDTDTNDTTYDCGALDGSTLLDDLTYFAKNDSTFMGTMNDADGTAKAKQKIATHIVVAGTLRTSGTGECSPQTLLTNAATNGGTTLYNASDPSTLENTLREAFAAIRAGAAAGSAASVISASRGGEGATYQAIFFPSIDLDDGSTVDWIGEVHALLVDSQGNLYEDTNTDRTLETGTDKRVIFFFKEDDNKTKVCRDGTVSNQVCSGTEIDLDDVKYLWSAAEWLSEITPVNATDVGTDIKTNRANVPAPYATAAGYISTTKKRYIFTWNDLDNDGIVDSTELLNFVDTVDWAGLTVNSTTTGVSTYRAPVPYDFGVTTDAAVDAIVNWIRGLDQTGLRKRAMPYDFDHNGTDSTVYWRLGDVIHSTPISVAAPSEGFHLLYRDNSYAEFVAAYKNRRHVIYYGGNDGMLHAVNGGFYNETSKKFCTTSNCASESSGPELGAELWAYVPYNLLPHLGCLKETDYTNQHKYFVDQRVRVFDMRLWPTSGDTVHPQGWGTIMVAAMRFGGAKLQPGQLDLSSTINSNSADYPGDTREFTSAYMVFDITDPERPPVLLGEMTRTTGGGFTDMGYTTPIPTAVTFKATASDANPDWYLILGSGPTELDGTSTQNAKVAVLPMDWLVSAPVKPFRIPDATPSSTTSQGGVFTISGSVFASDLVTVDFEIDTNYMSDAVYFGTLSGDWYDASTNPNGWGGGVYRLVTRQVNSSGNQVETIPEDWTLHRLVDTGQPVTASPTLGTDGTNYWVYFGTGRFLANDDKLDPETQSYYGIKEPMTFAESGGECKATLSWAEVERTDPGGSVRGALGLTDVSLIQVTAAPTGSDAALTCSGGGTACLPTAGTDTFAELTDYIVGTGTGCEGTPNLGTDGWVKDFQMSKERNLGQATLLGGLVTFTSYQPSTDQCSSEGLGYLYGLYFQTGTAYSEGVFISTDDPEGVDDAGKVIERVSLGRGLATTPNLHVGKHEGSKAFVQTSTGEIVEVPQPNLPLKSFKTGRISWGEIK